MNNFTRYVPIALKMQVLYGISKTIGIDMGKKWKKSQLFVGTF